MSLATHISRGSLKVVAVLFLIVGTVGGGLGGATMGFWFGQRLRQTGQPTVDAGSPPAPRPVASADAAVPSLARVDLGRPADAAAPSPDLGSKSAGTEVCVEIRDVGERRVPGALITWRSVVPNSLRPTTQVGELGVFSAPLPFPDEVIARGGPLASATPVGASGPAGAPSTLRSDGSGRACLRANGHIVISAVADERSASVELDLSSTSATASLGVVVLRLAIPADALCRLAAPTEPSEASSEPVSTQPAGDIEGRVTDARGFGVGGVRIDGQVGSSRAVAVSDARGSFRLTGLPRGSLSLSAQKRGYAPLNSSRRADEARSEIALTLLPGGGIAGVVRDHQRGQVPTGASLSLQSAGGSQPVLLSRDGQFSLTGLAPGAAVLRVRAPGFAPLTQAIEIPAGQSPDEITLRDLRLELVAGASLRGHIRSSRGSPAGVNISVLAEDGSVVARVLSDDRGEFQISDLPAGRLRITASAGSQRGNASVELRAGQQEQLQIDLQD